jgi:hypothetical protein
MVLVLWVWSLLFAALSFLNFSFAGENCETKKNERCLHYSMQIWYLRCFYGALLVSRSVAIL